MERDLGVCSAGAAHAWWRSRRSSGGTITPPALTYERNVLYSRTSENPTSRNFGEYPVLYNLIIHHDDSAARAEMGALHVVPTSKVTTTPRPARAYPAPRRAP
jgi:hypothetical protein